MRKSENTLDKCVNLQFSAITGSVFLLLVLDTVLIVGMLMGGLNYRDMSPLIFSALVGIGLGLSVYALRKIFYSSVFGADGVFFQSLPVSEAASAAARIIAAGIFLMGAFLPQMWMAANVLVGALLSNTSFHYGIPRLLMLLGYYPSTAPLFAALALLAVIAMFFAMAAATQLVVIVCQSSEKRILKRAWVCGLLIAVGTAIVIGGNIAPYWLMIKLLPGVPALVPAAALAVNVLLGGASGAVSVRLLEKHYKQDV